MFDATKAHADMRAYAEMHGWQARIGDNAAIQKTESNGYKVTESMRRDAVLEMVNHYEGGTTQWNLRAAGARAPAQNPVILAIAAKRGCSYADAERFLQEQFLSDIQGE